MIWSAVSFFACVGIQYLLTLGMKEPGRSAMLFATRFNAFGFGGILLLVMALVYLGAI